MNLPNTLSQDALSQWQHLRELMIAHEELDELRHREERRAIELASSDINRRLTEMNKFREQLESERGRYVTRDLHDALDKTLTAKLDKAEEELSNKVSKLERDINGELGKLRNITDERLKSLELMRSNLEGKIWMMGAIITALLGGLQLIFRAMR